MSSRERLTAASAVAVALASSALSPLYAQLGWLPPVLGSVLVVAVVGLVARRGGVPTLLAPVVQLVGLGLYACLVFAQESLWYGLVPTGRTVEAVQALVAAARKDILELVAPVPTHPGLLLCAVLGIGAVAVAVDLLAVGLGRSAVAGLPLLVLFALPSGVLPGGIGWLPFALGAGGWLALLLVESQERVGRWGAPLRTQGQAELEDSSLGRVGRRIGVAALGVSLVVPAMVPGLDSQLFPGNGPGGDGDGGARTTITYNPITRLQGDLSQPRPTQLLRYTTTDPEPDYLRMTTLDTFDGSTWRSSSLTGTRISDGIPAPVGVQASVAVRDVNTVIDVSPALDTRWLPAPATPTSVEVGGRWLWDPTSDTAFSTRATTRRVGSYEVNATRVLPDADLLRNAGPAAEQVREYAEPVEVRQSVVGLTRQVVGDAPTPYEQARALQAFFRDSRNGFEYSVSTGPRFDNPDALSAFLDRRGRQGFCEQYASAMAVMLRVLGIPSRVAVGFTPGTVQPDLSRIVTTADAHAWPEAWFEGAGWVRFEPTPAGNRTVVPAYSTEAADLPASTDSLGTGGVPIGPGEEQLGGSAGGPTEKLDRLDPAAPEVVAAPEAATSDGGPSPWLLLPIGLLLLAVAPALAHAARRRARWSSPGPLTGWQQVQEDAVDIGHRWRGSDSPRAAAARLAASAGLAGPAVEALHRLAVAAERERYARPGSAGDGTGLRADAGTVRRALLASAPGRLRARALLAPPATLRWMAHASGERVADALDRVDDAVSAVSRRLHRRPA
jgi:transglutaminase-like putative cysteine protease